MSSATYIRTAPEKLKACQRHCIFQEMITDFTSLYENKQLNYRKQKFTICGEFRGSEFCKGRQQQLVTTEVKKCCTSVFCLKQSTLQTSQKQIKKRDLFGGACIILLCVFFSFRMLPYLFFMRLKPQALFCEGLKEYSSMLAKDVWTRDTWTPQPNRYRPPFSASSVTTPPYIHASSLPRQRHQLLGQELIQHMYSEQTTCNHIR